MRYVVTKNFQDKFTGQYYGIGEIYETVSEKRANDLERGGYIAAEQTEMAATATGSAATGQNQAQQVAQQATEAAEAYTVIDGQQVNLKQAQQATEAAEAAATQTGIQQSHDNSTEAVKAGTTAQNQTKATGAKTKGKRAALREENLQSGQAELAKHVQGMKEAQGTQQTQQAQQTNVNEALEQKGQQLNEAAKVEDHAELNQAAAQEKTTKAAKK